MFLSFARALLLTLLLSAASQTASAQTFGGARRFELGKRLRELELEWDRQGDIEARTRAVDFLNKAVRAFFTLRMDRAAADLDRAHMALRAPEAEWNGMEVWLRGLSVQLEKPLMDPSAGPARVRLGELYRKLEEFPAAPIRWRAELKHPDLKKPIRVESPLIPPFSPLEVSLEGLTEGDWDLQISFSGPSGETLLQRNLRLSLASDLEQRLAKIRSAAAGSTGQRSRTELSMLLSELSAGTKIQETDFPALQLLRAAEAWTANPDRKLGAGEHWLFPANAKLPPAIRLWSPSPAKNPIPMVLALHGAGGSENMFFDTYGHGRIVELCKARNWLLVSPRLGLMGTQINLEALLLELEARLELRIDRSRIALIGHSMGAGVGAGTLSREPERIRACALISGGGRVTSSPALKGKPCYLSAGDKDFGEAGTRACALALQAIGARVELEIAAGLEHLIVVQESLPKVFAFFDRELGRSPPASPRPRLY